MKKGGKAKRKEGEEESSLQTLNYLNNHKKCLLMNQHQPEEGSQCSIYINIFINNLDKNNNLMLSSLTDAILLMGINNILSKRIRRINIFWQNNVTLPPENVQLLFPGTYEYVTLCGKRQFADVITLNPLRRGNYPVFLLSGCKGKNPSESEQEMC